MCELTSVVDGGRGREGGLVEGWLRQGQHGQWWRVLERRGSGHQALTSPLGCAGAATPGVPHFNCPSNKWRVRLCGVGRLTGLMALLTVLDATAAGEG